MLKTKGRSISATCKTLGTFLNLHLCAFVCINNHFWLSNDASCGVRMALEPFNCSKLPLSLAQLLVPLQLVHTNAM